MNSDQICFCLSMKESVENDSQQPFFDVYAHNGPTFEGSFSRLPY